ncbi:3-oxoacyl-ACP synthase [Rubeoparvulum massiliense]|uniref:3-oxoacyl-ACP synthase n=1 Tax=Rubeoparvulum massiliense TaxID=1631346 RepID=UPI00065DD236|nr:3-oxoacyl-ACP synthase [Rubeoparvulum massiliense]
MEQEEFIQIAGTSIYMTEGRATAQELSEKAGIPAEIIIEKFGLYEKRIAGRDEHVSDLAVKAARPLLEQEQVDPLEIDVLIYFGSPHKDYLVWSCATKIQHELGLKNAYAFELMNISAGFPMALKVAKDMLRSDAHIRKILLVGGCKESTLIDYENQRSRFMFNFGDGGAAALITRSNGLGNSTPRNRLLDYAFITNGAFHDFVKVPAGGTVQPASIESVTQSRHAIDVSNPEQMKAGLDPITLKNFVHVAQEAMERSGKAFNERTWLLPLHTKRSLFHQLLASLGLKEEQAVYLDHFGHMSALDPLFGFHLLKEQGNLEPGDTILFLSAGTGYSWVAMVMEWVGE